MDDFTWGFDLKQDCSNPKNLFTDLGSMHDDSSLQFCNWPLCTSVCSKVLRGVSNKPVARDSLGARSFLEFQKMTQCSP